MKRQNFSLLIFLFLLAAAVSACRGGHTGSASGEQGDTLTLRHARLLTIVEHDGYTEVSVSDPWNEGRTLHSYRIEQGRPVQRALITTSVHCALIDELGCRKAVAGVCDAQYMHLPWVHQGIKAWERSRNTHGQQGTSPAGTGIADCGNSLEPTLETIIALQPDAIFLSPFQNSGGYGRVEQLGIPIIEMADYMESSALGRAEWIRFYARLLGQAERGDSLFAAIEQAYTTLRDSIRQAPGHNARRQKMLMDKMVGQVWYMPGGQSTTGRMLTDAGARYPWAADQHQGSLSLSLETVLEQAADADVWMLRYNGAAPLTRSALLAENSAYRQFKAFTEGRVYGCNTEQSTFFEETPFHPERLLRDMVCIMHPEQGTPRYYHHVE